MLAIKWLLLFWVVETSLDRSTDGSKSAYRVRCNCSAALVRLCLFVCSQNITLQCKHDKSAVVRRADGCYTSGSIDSIVQWSTVKYRIFRASERSGLIISEVFRKHDFPHAVLYLSTHISSIQKMASITLSHDKCITTITDSKSRPIRTFT